MAKVAGFASTDKYMAVYCQVFVAWFVFFANVDTLALAAAASQAHDLEGYFPSFAKTTAVVFGIQNLLAISYCLVSLLHFVAMTDKAEREFAIEYPGLPKAERYTSPFRFWKIAFSMATGCFVIFTLFWAWLYFNTGFFMNHGPITKCCP